MRPTKAKLPASCLVALAIVAATIGSAKAASCPGNPDALGTSRTIVVDPKEHPRIGTMQYGETLPLEDHEVVLTFDDGPLPAHTNSVLETLAAHCVKATFFLVGRMAKAYPQDVRRIHDAGHTIGTHSENHPTFFGKLPQDRMAAEIDDGIAHVSAALGDPSQLAPFFRIPGLRRGDLLEAELSQRGLMTWSADFPADDWRRISSAQVTQYALSRLEAKGKGVLLLHDIQSRTQAALPVILQELKARGYRIVHVVPATAQQPKTVTDPAQWIPSWIHHPTIASKGRQRFVFGAVETPRNMPRSERSVWLAKQRPLARHAAIILHPSSVGAFRIERARTEADVAAHGHSHDRHPLPAGQPAESGNAPSHPATRQIVAGSRADARPKRDIR